MRRYSSLVADLLAGATMSLMSLSARIWIQMCSVTFCSVRFQYSVWCIFDDRGVCAVCETDMVAWYSAQDVPF